MNLRPDAYAVVMATGIVSVAASDHRHPLISDVLVAIAVAAFAVLIVLGVRRWDTGDPDVVLGLFTFVAACAVLASRLREYPLAWWLLGVTAAVVWFVLVVLAVRAMASCSWRGLRDRAHGGWELASVATSGVAIVAVEVSRVAAAVFWVLALAVYVLMTWLILRRAASGAGFAPDHWILMGGLAIATLAGTQLHIALVVGTWLLATAWIPVLAYLTVRFRPGLVQFGWWAMVFPLGMYSSATYAAAVQTGWKDLTVVSSAFLWIALAAWLAIAVITLVRFRHVLTR